MNHRTNVSVQVKPAFAVERDGRRYDKIGMIKAMRECFALSLKDAKDFVEDLCESMARPKLNVPSNMTFDSKYLRSLESYRMLSNHFDFFFLNEESTEEYVQTIESAIKQALHLRRYRDARLLIDILETTE